MRVDLLRSSFLTAFLPLLPLAAQDAPPTPRAEVARSVEVQAADFDAADLAQHYANVEAELRAAPLPADPAIAARRLAAIDLLHEYRIRGNFGYEQSDSGARNARFVDGDGRRCAVAFLLDRTGEGRLTNAIAARNNDAWVVELAGDPELQKWLAAHGLTAVEAARIQGPHWGGGGRPGNNPPPPEVIPWRNPRDPAPASAREPRPAFWRAPTAPAASTRTPTPPAGQAATATAARPNPGIPVAALGAPEWVTWWDWNRARFEPPAPEPVEEGTATRSRSVSREQAIAALRALAEHEQADVRAAAKQALGRMLALGAIDKKTLEDDVREERLRTLATVACTPELRELHRLAGTTLPALDGEDALVALAACGRSPSEALRGMLEPRLLEAVADASPDAVAAAALAAVHGPKPRFRERAREIVREDGDDWRRSLVAASLAHEAAAEDVAALTVALGARSPGVRRAAAIALGRTRAELALPALMTAYELEHEQGAKGIVLLAIGDHGGKAALPFLREQLANGPRALRVLAAIGLGLAVHERDDDDETERLFAAMRADHNSDHDGGYLLALGLTGDIRALPILHAQLHSAPTSAARGAAAGALGLLRSPASISELALAADSDSCPFVRGQCAHALGRIGDEATEVLAELLVHEFNPDVRSAAAAALGDAGSARAAALLLAAARDASTPAPVLASVAAGLGRHFRRAEPTLPFARAAMDPQAMPALIAWVASQDL